ncbi:MFS transporter [Neisseria sp. Ec49-e6-T10]|uniref:MFS transporter n=1 Tax=Neisseria sp. Ec49-e6-T10 TaxID=3140744 RepID=UPI003EB7F5CC
MTEEQTIKKALTPSLLLLMAAATGIAVASNYYAQPLLHTIAENLNLSFTTAGSIVTVAQLGYALGLVFLVPLGDILERKKLIIIMMLLSTAGLVVSACAQNFMHLIIGTVLTGLFVVVAQLLVPFAATLAEPAYRGRAVGIVMSGLLLGILLARTFAGIVSELGSWRTVYWVASAMMLCTTVALAIKLPKFYVKNDIHYVGLIKSIFHLFVQFPALRTRSLLGALDFAVFSVLWTPLAFLLSDAPYHFSDFQIGLFGLAGAAGALAAPYAGKFADQGKSAYVTRVGLILLLLSWLPLVFAQSSIILLIIGIIVLDLCVQLVHIINMNEVFKLMPEARNRLNADYMFSYFIGGTLGSLSSAFVYEHFGWLGVVALGVGLSLLAIIVWEKTKNKYSTI